MDNKYNQYVELKAQCDALKKQLDALKAELIEQLEAGPSIIDGDKIVYSDGVGKVSIAETKTINSKAWDLVNAADDPGVYINYGTRTTLTVKLN